MSILISCSKALEDYDFASFNGKRQLTLSTGARTLVLKSGDTFGYRSARKQVYVVTPERGLTYEYKLTEEEFDRRIAPKADEVKVAKAKKLFAVKAVKPVAKPTPAPEPVKKVLLTTPGDKQSSEEHELVVAYGNPTRFARIKTSGDAIGYMAEVWSKVNIAKCDNLLVRPNFLLSKDMGTSTRRMGFWSPSRRVIGASPRLFKAKEHVALTTIVHEIAHQAVSEIEKIVESVQKGHGPVWSKWMRKLGLTPDRKSQFDMLEYFDDSEKQKIEKQIEEAKKRRSEQLDARQAQEFPKVLPREFRVVQWYKPSDKTWYKGMIICPNDQAGKRWAFLRMGMATSFDIVPADWFHDVSQEDAEKYAPLKEVAIRIKQYIENKQQRRSRQRTRTSYLG